MPVPEPRFPSLPVSPASGWKSVQAHRQAIAGLGTEPPDQVRARSLSLGGEVPEIGSRLGCYQLEQSLNPGGAKRVVRAWHLQLDIPVVLRCQRIEDAPSLTALRHQLRREAQLLARIHHPRISRLWQLEIAGAFPFIALEYVDGFSLYRLIRSVGRLSPRLAVGILRQAVEALDAIWQQGVVHRAVKASNLLIDRQGMVKLTDFSLAAVAGAKEPAESVLAAANDAAVLGSVGYLAPELFVDPYRVDPRTDIYALGVTLYHAVTGRLPFVGASIIEVITRHLHGEAIPPMQRCAEVSKPLNDLILRMMARCPEQRLQDYAALRAAIGQVVDDR